MFQFRAMIVFATLLALVVGCAPTPPAANSRADSKPNSPDPRETAVVKGNQQPPLVPVTPRPAIREEAAPAFRGEIVTEGEYFDAARAIEQGMVDGTAYMKFDPGLMVRAALGGFEINQTLIGLAAQDYIPNGAETFEKITSGIENGNSYQLMRVVRSEGKHRAVFRISGPEGLNYHVMDLTKNERGAIVGCDIFMALSDEHLSMTIRKMLLPGLENYPLVAKELARPDGEYVRDFEKIRPITAAIEAENFQEVLAQCEMLPPAMQKTKLVMVLRINSAARIGDLDKFNAATEEFRRERPNEITPDLLGLAVYAATNQPDAMLNAIDRIDQYVGGDPYLDVPRAQAAVAKHDLNTAEKLLLKAAASPITPPEVHEELVGLSLQRKEFDKTLTHLLELERRLGIRLPDVKEFPEYAEFVKTEQYQEWLKRERK